MYTIEQIRKAGIEGEINSIDVEHLIEVLVRMYKENEGKNFEDEEFEDYYDDEEDPLESLAENCTCGAYAWGNGKWHRVSDCCC